MSFSIDQFVIWFHLVSMAGALGGLYFMHWVVEDGNLDGLKRGVRLFNFFIIAGILAGLHLYGQKIMAAKEGGFDISHVHQTVGIKITLLLAAGACVGISAKASRGGKTGKASTLRLAGVIIMALAAYLGVTLRS